MAMMHIDLTACEEFLLQATLIVSAVFLLIRVFIIGVRDVKAELRETTKNSNLDNR